MWHPYRAVGHRSRCPRPTAFADASLRIAGMTQASHPKVAANPARINHDEGGQRPSETRLIFTFTSFVTLVLALSKLGGPPIPILG